MILVQWLQPLLIYCSASFNQNNSRLAFAQTLTCVLSLKKCRIDFNLLRCKSPGSAVLFHVTHQNRKLFYLNNFEFNDFLTRLISILWEEEKRERERLTRRRSLKTYKSHFWKEVLKVWSQLSWIQHQLSKEDLSKT